MNFALLKLVLGLVTSLNYYAFFIKKRYPDLLLLSVFFLFFTSAPLYFSEYCFTKSYCIAEYNPLVYTVFIVFNFVLFFFSFVNISNRKIYKPLKSSQVYFNSILFLITFLIFIHMLNKLGWVGVFFGHKSQLTGQIGALFELFVWLSVFLSVSIFYQGVAFGSKITVYSSVLPVLLLIFLGDRTGPAVFIVASILIYLRMFDKVSVLSNKRLLIIFILLIFMILIGSFAKSFYSDFRSAGFIGLLLGFDRRTITDYLGNIELFNTPFILNEIVNSGFRVDGSTLISSFLSLLPIRRSWFGDSSSAFGKAMQEGVFANVNFGVGHSYFGEFYATGGVIGLLLAALILAFILLVLNVYFMSIRNYYLLVFISIVSSIFCFYIYRNTLTTSFGFIRFFFYPTLVIYVCSLLILRIRSKQSSDQSDQSGR